MTLTSKLPTVDLFFQQLPVRVEFHFHFDLLEAMSTAHQHLADKEHFAVIFILHGEVVAQIDMPLDCLTTTIAFNLEGIQARCGS